MKYETQLLTQYMPGEFAVAINAKLYDLTQHKPPAGVAVQRVESEGFQILCLYFPRTEFESRADNFHVFIRDYSNGYSIVPMTFIVSNTKVRILVLSSNNEFDNILIIMHSFIHNQFSSNDGSNYFLHPYQILGYHLAMGDCTIETLTFISHLMYVCGLTVSELSGIFSDELKHRISEELMLLISDDTLMNKVRFTQLVNLSDISVDIGDPKTLFLMLLKSCGFDLASSKPDEIYDGEFIKWFWKNAPTAIKNGIYTQMQEAVGNLYLESL